MLSARAFSTSRVGYNNAGKLIENVVYCFYEIILENICLKKNFDVILWRSRYLFSLHSSDDERKPINAAELEWTWLAATEKRKKHKFTGSLKATKRFSAFKFTNWNLSAKSEKCIQFPKSTLEGKSKKKTVSGIRHRTRECAKTSLEAYKLYFGFKDCFLAKIFSIGIKVSFKNAAYDFIQL